MFSCSITTATRTPLSLSSRSSGSAWQEPWCHDSYFDLLIDIRIFELADERPRRCMMVLPSQLFIMEQSRLLLDKFCNAAIQVFDHFAFCITLSLVFPILHITNKDSLLKHQCSLLLLLSDVSVGQKHSGKKRPSWLFSSLWTVFVDSLMDATVDLVMSEQ